MRIVCKNLDAFKKNLTGAKDLMEDIIFNSTVWVDTSEVLQGDFGQSVKYLIILQMGAIKRFPDGGEALVECGIECGYDFRDSTQDYEGTEMAEDLKKELATFCEEQGFVLKPGVLYE
jgi:translation initiation factor 1 (eIF-1/SUI1)